LGFFYLPSLLLDRRGRFAIGFFFIPKSLLPMEPFFFGVGCDGFPGDSSTYRLAGRIKLIRILWFT
jgi:hypothetical protein